MAAWYVEHLGCGSCVTPPAPSQIHFLADAAGRAIIEIYRNAVDAIPDYTAIHPIRFHVAFAAAGATFVEESTTPGGSRLLMLRDPWGIAFQLCKRPTPLP